MNACQIVDRVGNGVKDALKTNQLFLGVERSDFENANIFPEYVTTVKVAENLAGPDYVVSLETQMKMLRRQAIGIAKIKNGNNKNCRNEIVRQLSRYKFGKKDSERLDVLVRSECSLSPPHLMAEAKLGVRNIRGILNDIDRIVKLLSMYNEAGAFDNNSIYGAVIFHLMEENLNVSGLKSHAKNFINIINDHLSSNYSEYNWLYHNSGLLSSCQISEGVNAYEEHHDDGAIEKVCSKDKFTFMPGLILLGNADDIKNVSF